MDVGHPTGWSKGPRALSCERKTPAASAAGVDETVKRAVAYLPPSLQEKPPATVVFVDFSLNVSWVTRATSTRNAARFALPKKNRLPAPIWYAVPLSLLDGRPVTSTLTFA